MKIVTDKITLKDLKKMGEKSFNGLVKAVVDVEEEIMAVDAELHSDEEDSLIKNDSKQENLWGINLYPDKTGDEFLEFDSMINVRPSFGNKSRGVDDLKTQQRIKKIVSKLTK